MNWQKIKAITGLGVFALFVVGAGVGAWLVQQNQDTRQQASGGCEFMTQTDKVPGLYTKISGSQVAFCDPDGGEYSILVKYNDKPVDQEKILQETKTFNPGEVVVYDNSCPPPDASYTGNLAININTVGQTISQGWGHVYICGSIAIQPDIQLQPIATDIPQTPENAAVTQSPVEPTLSPTFTPIPTAIPTFTPTATPVPTESIQPTQAVVPTIVPLTTSSLISPTSSPQTSGAGCNETCTSTSDCAESTHICADTSVGKRCRLATDPASLLCVLFEDSLSPTPTSQPPTATSAPLPQCRADLNKDGFVDLSDYTFIRERFLLRDGNRKSYIAEADIDQDGVVDLIDYSILVQEFFMHCQNE